MRRGKHTIILQVLTICKTGANKTKIVYQGNLNFKTATYYIDLLINNGLINVEEGNPSMYQTTAKGVNLLKNLLQVNSELVQISSMAL
jgi:predicted transcriptional regulator